MSSAAQRPTVGALAEGVARGDRAMLSRAITLVESSRDADREMARELFDRLPPTATATTRVGITGIPGAGKSTFIDALGIRLADQGHRIAVLAVDPSSEVTGGSILGDKTRMERLSRSAQAFIRPSPSADATGGAAPSTREVMALCEAAGFDTVFVETVGAGQSELAVAHMVDTFVLLGLAGTGDELQGIKRGIMEMADVIVIHKADGAHRDHLETACSDFAASQRLLAPGRGGWAAPVVPASSVTGAGLDDVWQAVAGHREHLGAEGIRAKRSRQALHWFDEILVRLLERDFLANPAVAAALPEVRRQVLDGKIQPGDAARELVRKRLD